MSLFSRKTRRTARILPDNLGDTLVAYGRNEFGFDRNLSPTELLNSPANDAVLVLSQLQLGVDGEQAIVELRDAAFSEGGWAIYGASYAVMAFLPAMNETETAEELHAARVDFLRSLGLPEVRANLSIDDISRWRARYPGEL